MSLLYQLNPGLCLSFYNQSRTASLYSRQHLPSKKMWASWGLRYTVLKCSLTLPGGSMNNSQSCASSRNYVAFCFNLASLSVSWSFTSHLHRQMFGQRLDAMNCLLVWMPSCGKLCPVNPSISRVILPVIPVQQTVKLHPGNWLPEWSWGPSHSSCVLLWTLTILCCMMTDVCKQFSCISWFLLVCLFVLGRRVGPGTGNNLWAEVEIQANVLLLSVTSGTKTPWGWCLHAWNTVCV